METLEQYKAKYLMVLEEQLHLHRQLKNQEMEIAHLRNLVYQKDKDIEQLLPKTRPIPRFPTPAKEISDTESDKFIGYTHESDKERKRKPSLNANKPKFDALADGTSIPRQCGDCHATHTSGHWCLDQHVKNGHICQKCYRRRKKMIVSGIEFIPTHECSNCTSKTSPMWFKHPNQGGKYLCSGCKDQIKITCNILSPKEPQSPVSTCSHESTHRGSRISDLLS
ncbi:hypothetical protein HDV01_004744 [Terramyces sp. JEL0728]|nr:hypothetical protein HDV01_006040 [Terramyces sp. JEL0728]KAJ3273105.1 hypothetical protein HDV01_004744 [Terramyces sp. JEL0728]